jgi:hypothetical protein
MTEHRDPKDIITLLLREGFGACQQYAGHNYNIRICNNPLQLYPCLNI